MTWIRCSIVTAAFTSLLWLGVCGTAGRAEEPTSNTGYLDPDAPARAETLRHQPRRRAILVGMEKYRAEGYVDSPGSSTVKFNNLSTPCKGVVALERKLHSIHWKAANLDGTPADQNEVFSFCNEGFNDARELIRTSIEQLDGPDDLLIIFLAGHGARVGSRNYFFKSLADIDLNVAANRYAANPDNPLFLGAALDLESTIVDSAGLNYPGNVVVILDTCRDDPLHRILMARMHNNGRAVMIQPPAVERASSGLMFFYATSGGYRIVDDANQTGQSYLAGALSDRIRSGDTITTILADAKRKVIQDTLALGQEGRQTPLISEIINNPQICFAGCAVFAGAGSHDGRLQLAFLQDMPGPGSHPQRSDSFHAIVPMAQPRAAVALPTERYTTYRQALNETPLIQRNVEIFWCKGAGEHLRRARAEKLGRTLGNATAEGFAGPGTVLGRVRSTWLTAEENARASFNVSNNAVRFDRSDATPASFAEAIRNASPVALRFDSARTPSTAPIPVFFCYGARKAAVGPRLWVQAAREDQRAVASALAGLVDAKLARLFVSQKVEVMPSSPTTTQVRYFYEEDRESAEAVARVLSPALGELPQLVFLRRYQKTAEPGLLELWMGTLTEPTTVAAQLDR